MCSFHLLHWRVIWDESLIKKEKCPKWHHTVTERPIADLGTLWQRHAESWSCPVPGGGCSDSQTRHLQFAPRWVSVFSYGERQRTPTAPFHLLFLLWFLCTVTPHQMAFTTSSNMIKKLLWDTDTTKHLWGNRSASREEKLNRCHSQTPKNVCCMLQIPINPPLHTKTKKALNWGNPWEQESAV